jgi:hypothetical protein
MSELYLAHHGIKGQKWGVRRYQNYDGTRTNAGKMRYGSAADYATPTEKQQKAYYKTTKKHLSNEYSDTLGKMINVGNDTDLAVRQDLRPLGKKKGEARKTYIKEYEKELEKVSNDEKKLREYAKRWGDKDAETASKIDLAQRMLADYKNGYDVLKMVDHTTKALKSKKESFNEADRALFSEAKDYTEKLLGKYGNKSVTELQYAYGRMYSRTHLAKTFVSAALQTYAEIDGQIPREGSSFNKGAFNVKSSAYHKPIDRYSSIAYDLMAPQLRDQSMDDFNRLFNI